MSDIDEFKEFLKTIPSIKEDVLNKKYTWQQIYEIYKMYGKEDKFFDSYRGNSIDINGVLNVVKNIDLNALSDSLQSIEKVLNIIGGLMSSKQENKKDWFNE